MPEFIPDFIPDFIMGGLVFFIMAATLGFIEDFFGDRQVRADLKQLWNEWKERE